MKKKLLIISVLLVAVFAFSACNATDVIANYSIKSFDWLTERLGADNYEYADGEHRLASPNGTERFIWGKKVAVEIDIGEFRTAGLSHMKLMKEMEDSEQTNMTLPDGSNILTIFMENAAAVTEQDKSKAFEQNIRKNRKALMFDQKAVHFSLSLDSMTAFHWAQYLEENERSMVFVLDPAAFVNAGLDVYKLTNWKHAEMEMEENGKTVKEFKLLRFYDLKNI